MPANAGEIQFMDLIHTQRQCGWRMTRSFLFAREKEPIYPDRLAGLSDTRSASELNGPGGICEFAKHPCWVAWGQE